MREVVALLSSEFRSARVTGVAISVRTSTALLAAFWKDSEMVVGWIPAWGGLVWQIIESPSIPVLGSAAVACLQWKVGL